MKNKRPLRLLAVVCALALSMTAFSTVAYAGGGDYYDSELPPAENTEPEETTTPEEETTVETGTPFTEDGIAATRDLLYDKHTNKQYITIETRNGNTFYIVIDYDKQLDEEEERYRHTSLTLWTKPICWHFWRTRTETALLSAPVPINAWLAQSIQAASFAARI